MGTFENRIEYKADQLRWSTVRVAATAAKFGISGASEASLSKAFNKTKDLSTDTALALDLLLGRFLKMSEAFKPFDIRLDDPNEAKKLLEDFEGGNLVVSVTRQEPGALIRGVYLLERLGQPNKLFQGVVDGQSQWGIEGKPIKDREIAEAAAKRLDNLSQPCRVVATQMRTVESNIAKSLTDMGLGGSDGE